MINVNKITTRDTINYSDEEYEKMAMAEQERLQRWHDKKESGNLTEEEKIAIANTKKFMEFDGDIFSLSPEEFKAIFE